MKQADHRKAKASMHSQPNSCGRMISINYGFKFACSNLRPCPVHDKAPIPAPRFLEGEQ